MAIPKIKEQDIIAALKYIDENGVPFHNQSTKYELVTDDGKKYEMFVAQMKVSENEFRQVFVIG